MDLIEQIFRDLVRPKPDRALLGNRCVYTYHTNWRQMMNGKVFRSSGGWWFELYGVFHGPFDCEEEAQQVQDEEHSAAQESLVAESMEVMS